MFILLLGRSVLSNAYLYFLNFALFSFLLFLFFVIHEKALREMQTLRVGCSKAEPKIFAPPQTHFPGVQDGQNLISWRWSLPSPTNPVW